MFSMDLLDMFDRCKLHLPENEQNKRRGGNKDNLCHKYYMMQIDYRIV